MTFKYPWVLFFIPALIFGVMIYAWRMRQPAFRFSSVTLVEGLKRSWKVRLMRLPFFLRLLTLLLFFVALSGPRTWLEETSYKSEGVNIMLVMDVSTSMMAEDFTLDNKRMNRLEVVKKVINDFIKKRTGDRIGLIAFAAQPYVVSPLTVDYGWLKTNLDRVKFGVMTDGTAIGSAIVSTVNRLLLAEGKSKVLILLTDGINNAGKVDPLTAAKAAEAKGVKIYSIGVGSRGAVPYPVVDLFGRRGYQNIQIELDEAVLTEIARLTGGAYFRATDTATLQEIYSRIDSMEKVKFEQSGFRQYQEHFDKFLIAALLVLILEVVLSRTVFLRIP